MNVICSICSDQLTQSDDIFYTRCGHVFHLQCLNPWLERSPSCPQCREKVTQNRIRRLYFTFSNNEAVEPQGPALQEKVDSLKFQILLKEKDIQFHSSNNVTLKKQNAGLKQEVRKVESEINQKNAAIHALKEQIKYFKEQSACCDELKRENVRLKSKIEEFKQIHVLLNGPLSDVGKMVGRTKDPETLTTYIAIMKKELIKSFAKCKQLRMTVKKLQEKLANLSTKSNTSLEMTTKMDLEEKIALSESRSIALQKRVDELEEILGIDQKCNSLSKIEKAQSQNSISEESPTEIILETDNEEISIKNSILNCAAKQKIEETCRDDTKNVHKKMHHSPIEVDSSNSELDLIEGSSSNNSPILIKKMKLSGDNSSSSDKSDNKFSSNSISKKKRKISIKNKVSEARNKHNNHVVDLT
ncbi:unnamed protein product [Xylocopa violacea]|uniref:RING-type domain-containing protein n=1 Tax=Xylocopa violacea TaxID=135666 RepID=A0ABP1NV99_XYLVO